MVTLSTGCFLNFFKFKCYFFSVAYIKLTPVIYHFKKRFNRILIQQKLVQEKSSVKNEIQSLATCIFCKNMRKTVLSTTSFRTKNIMKVIL